MAKQPTLTLHGIPNCDTVKKARDWLTEHGLAYAFHNFKTDGVDRKRLETWVRQAGWEVVLNRAGTTFRALPESEKSGLDAGKAIALILAQPSLIKRPVLTWGEQVLIGFKPAIYAETFGA